MVDEVLLRTVRTDVALEREFAGDDLLDRDFLVPAVAAVLFLAARFGHFLGTAQRTSRLSERLAWHRPILSSPRLHKTAVMAWSCQRAAPSRDANAGAYMVSTYSFTIRRALKRAPTVAIALRTTRSQPRGM